MVGFRERERERESLASSLQNSPCKKLDDGWFGADGMKMTWSNSWKCRLLGDSVFAQRHVQGMRVSLSSFPYKFCRNRDRWEMLTLAFSTNSIVEYGSPEEAQRAIKELSDTPLMGRPVFIREVGNRWFPPSIAIDRRGLI